MIVTHTTRIDIRISNSTPIITSLPHTDHIRPHQISFRIETLPEFIRLDLYGGDKVIGNGNYWAANARASGDLQEVST